MNLETSRTDDVISTVLTTVPGQVNPFIGHECVLKTCCKKYKKGKRCKKCPD